MERRKRVAVVLVVLILAFTLTASAETARLNFKNGEFKILIIADTQDDTRLSQYTFMLINRALDKVQPDLIVLNGDNIMGSAPSLIVNPAGVKEAIDSVVASFAGRLIPFGVVFGNHDPETIVKKTDQIKHYQSWYADDTRLCVTEMGVIGSSVGNSNALIYGTDGQPVANLWFIDSNRKIRTEYGSGYAFVTTEQIEWYERTSSELARQNGGEPLPSFLFQHIPVPEMYELLTEVPKGTEGAVEGSGHWEDHYYILNEALVTAGSMNEGPYPPDVNNGQFDSWKRQGDVVAAFFGHDHVNDFAGKLDGIDLVYTPGAGFYSYGNGYKHGVRLVTIPEANPSAYTTEVLYYEDLVAEPIPAAIMFNGEMPWFIAQWILIGLGVVTIFGGVVFLIVRKAVRRKRSGKQFHR